MKPAAIEQKEIKKEYKRARTRTFSGYTIPTHKQTECPKYFKK